MKKLLGMFFHTIFVIIAIVRIDPLHALPNNHNALLNTDPGGGQNAKQLYAAAAPGVVGASSNMGASPNSMNMAGHNSNSFTSNYCDYDIDIFNCLNVNCNSLKHIRKFPRTLKEIIPYQLKPNQFLCAVDMSDTGITELSAADTFEHFSFFYANLLKINPNQTTIKLSFSGIEVIRELRFPVDLNLVLFIRDSQVSRVQQRALSGNNKLEMNFINANFTIVNWFNLLEGSRLKLLNLRNIQNLREEFALIGLNPRDVAIAPTTSIVDLKVHYSYLPVLDDNFVFFKMLKSVEQLDLVRCSISFIKNAIFDKSSGTFRGLKYLTLANNNINRITEQTFSGLVNLVVLDLDENPIEYVHQNTFTSLKKLRVLSMNANVAGTPVIKSLNPTSVPVWLFNVFTKNRELREVNYKTNRLLNSYCVLNTVISNIKSFNENINAYLSMGSNSTTPMGRLHNEAYESSTSYHRKLKLFTQEQLEAKYELLNERNHMDLYCNVYLVCKYTQVYDEADTTNLWVVDTFRACPSIVLRNYDFKCGFEQRNLDCQNAQQEVKNKIPAHMTANRTTLYEETPGITGIKTIMNNLKEKYFKTNTGSGYIFVGVCFLVVLSLVVCCATCSYVRSRKRDLENTYYMGDLTLPLQSQAHLHQLPPLQVHHPNLPPPNTYYMPINKELRGQSMRRASTHANSNKRVGSRSKSIY